MNVVRLSSLRTGRLYPQEIFLVLIFVRGCQPQGHIAAGRIMSMQNSNGTIGNRTRDLPVCSAVPQPTVPSRAPHNFNATFKRSLTESRQRRRISVTRTGNKLLFIVMLGRNTWMSVTDNMILLKEMLQIFPQPTKGVCMSKRNS